MKTCQQCGAHFSRRRSEAHWQYAKRRYCTPHCRDDATQAARQEAARARIEDLEFLASVGVGATEAARRTGFRDARMLESYLRRHGRSDLMTRLARQDYLPVRHPQARGPRRVS